MGEEPEIFDRVTALEIILLDLIASDLMESRQPQKAAAEYRERLKTLMAGASIKGAPSEEAYLTQHGDISDAVDALAKRIEGTIRLRLAARKSPP